MNHDVFQSRSFDSHDALAVLQKLNLGICVLTREAQVEFYNQSALRIFAKADHLILTGADRLICTSSKEQDSQLQRMIHRALTRRCTSRDHLMLICDNQSQGEVLLLAIQPFGKRLNGKLEDNKAVVTLCMSQKILSISMLSQLIVLYGLSHAEAEICRWIMLGMTGVEIASLRQVSYETIKSQTRSVLAKTRCKRRLELVRMLTLVSQPWFSDP